MSTSMAQAVGLLRLSVAGPDRRADLAVPAAVPVADLLPELARAVGALDPYLVHAGYRLVTADGTVLQPAAGLGAQGVEDGAVLTLEVAAHDQQPPAYDDVVEAVADAVESSTRPWDAAAGRRAALAAAALLLGAAAVALGLERSHGWPVAGAAAILAVLLLAGSAVLARAQRAPEPALVVGWLALPWAVVAGLAAAPDDPLGRLPMALAGIAALVAAFGVMAAVLQHRAAVLPAVVAAAGAAAGGAVLSATDFPVAAVAAVVLVVVVLAAGVVPVVALSSSRLRAPAPRDDVVPGSSGAEPGLDSERIGDSVRTGREVLLGLTAATALVLVLTAPLLPRLGVSGALLGVAAAGVVMLRTRRERAFADVVLGVGGGVLALALLVGAAALVHPGWRTVLAAVVVGTAVVLLLASAVSSRPRLWAGRAADVAEGVATVALLPLVVLAIGLIAAVRS